MKFCNLLSIFVLFVSNPILGGKITVDIKNEITAQNKKVAIVGTGRVGSTCAYALMLDGVVSELALINRTAKTAQGHALDLMHGMQFTKQIKVEAGDSFELVKDAKIVIVAAGSAYKSGLSVNEVLRTNITILKEIVPKIVEHNKDCILLVVSNPLDLLTYATYKLSGFDKSKVFGTGTALETSRLRYFLSEEFSINIDDIAAYVLGDHLGFKFVWWSNATIAGVPISKIVSEKASIDINKKLKKAAIEVIRKKGCTCYGVSTVTAAIVKSILLNEKKTFSVSQVLKNYRGISDVAMGVPAVIGYDGICQQLEIVLNEEEEKKLHDCANRIKTGMSKTGIL